VPPAALAAADGGGPLRSLVESVVGAAQHKSAVLGDRFHAAAELATGQKIAAVAASAAALAGGGTAIDEFANHGPPLPAPVQQSEAEPVKKEVPVEPAPPAAEAPPTDAPPALEPAPTPTPEPPPPPPDPATEFAPGASATPAPSGPSAPAAPTPPAGGEFTSRAGDGGGDTGEFAP
jgi:outer membrane biosynthesis protein TonB